FGQLLIIHGDTLLLWRDKAYHFSAVGFFYTSIRVSQLLSEFWHNDNELEYNKNALDDTLQDGRYKQIASRHSEIKLNLTESLKTLSLSIKM
ncbi:hypothetical protein ACRN96_06645, partial [Shewanella oncorhynchi]|uniref:hypothetical protein n=1 Tax=Shewanella oncorhynchi TaxID=2726434 RepID=UPI003D7BFE15